MGLGLLGAFAAALWGLTQRNPKAVLAYSTVSQMGLMLLLVGAGVGAGQAVAFYALHHGLAKGALFLLVGVAATTSTPRERLATLVLAGAAALSVAGLPLTGGALVKAAAKEGLAPAATFAVTLSGVTTTLILAWFLHRLAVERKPTPGQNWAALAAGAAFLALAAMLAPWVLWSGATHLPAGYPLRASVMFDAAWPVLAGLALATLVIRRPAPELPPGDLLTLSPRRARLHAQRRPVVVLPAALGRKFVRLLIRARTPELALRRWSAAGGLLVAGVLLLAILLVDF
jgi:hydrogenase-4 component B